MIAHSATAQWYWATNASYVASAVWTNDAGTAMTGSVKDAIAWETARAMDERSLSAGTSTNTYRPKWYLWERANVVRYKNAISNACGYFIDRAYTNAAGMLTNTGTFGVSDLVDATFTPSTLCVRASLPINFFTTTPWVALKESTNGWVGVRRAINQLVWTFVGSGGTNGVRYRANVIGTNGLAGATNTLVRFWGQEITTNTADGDFYGEASSGAFDPWAGFGYTNLSSDIRVGAWRSDGFPSYDAPTSAFEKSADLYYMFSTGDVYNAYSPMLVFESFGDTHVSDQLRSTFSVTNSSAYYAAPFMMNGTTNILNAPIPASLSADITYGYDQLGARPEQLFTQWLFRWDATTNGFKYR